MEYNKKKSRSLLVGICSFFGGVVVAVAIVFLILMGIGNYKMVDSDSYKIMSEFYTEYHDLCAVDKAIDSAFYLERENEDSADGACKGLVDSLGDPYSSYMNKDEYANFMASSTGEYSGVGITFSTDEDGNYVVVSVMENSPASNAGMKPGDILLEIDDKTYDDQDVMANSIRGEKGTKVKVKYSRDNKENTVSIVRDKIKQESVSYKSLEDGIGYINVNQFIDHTAEDFDKAVEALEASGCNKLILDLRDNGGGLVNEAVRIADEFIDSGLIAYTEDKQGESVKYEAHEGKLNMDTVLLVNENSASSSEILAGAMKDNGYKLIGTKTFGKGIIQSTMELHDGSAVKLTIAQYFTPKGNVVHKKGIEPDYEVENPKDSDIDKQLKKAEGLLK